MPIEMWPDTTPSYSGGTSVEFKLQTIEGSTRTYVAVDDDLQTRRVLKHKVSSPSPNKSSPSGYTQARNVLTLLVPKVLANGDVTVNSIQCSLSSDIETTDAERVEMLVAMGQAINDSLPATEVAHGAFKDNIQLDD